jgi:hypothetical protein
VHVDAAELRDGLVRDTLRICKGGDVGLEGQDLAADPADLIGRAIEFRAQQIDQRDVAAGPGERLCASPADAPGAAGDD